MAQAVVSSKLASSLPASSGSLRRLVTDKNLQGLFVRVLSFLGARSLSSAAPVSTHWNCTSKIPSLWMRVDMSQISPGLVTDAVMIGLFKAHRSISELSLAFCSKVSNKTLQAASVLLQNLTHLNMEGGRQVTDGGILAVVKSCKSLQHLNISGCSQLTSSGIKRVLTAFGSATNSVVLSSLKEVDDKMLVLLAQTSVKRVTVNSCSSISDAGVMQLVQSMPKGQLESFCAAYCSSLTDTSVELLTQRCPSLEELNLYGCQITDRSMAFLGSLRSLRVLDLSMCRSITDEGVKALLSMDSQSPGSARELRSLNFYDCGLLTDASLREIAKWCPKMNFVGLFGLSKISGPGVAALVRATPSIRRIDIGGAAWLSAAELQQLETQFPRVLF